MDFGLLARISRVEIFMADVDKKDTTVWEPFWRIVLVIVNFFYHGQLNFRPKKCDLCRKLLHFVEHIIFEEVTQQDGEGAADPS